MKIRPLLVFAATLAVLALGARNAMAAQGLEISMAGGTLTATGHTEGQAIIFSYQASCGDDSKPCYVFHSIAGTEDAGTTAPGCKTEAGITECPATGIGKITINMAANGNFEFNDGSHHVTCSPAPVTIQTGATLANIDIWNGCSETVICEAKTTVATVNADASDSIRGHCMVEKH